MRAVVGICLLVTASTISNAQELGDLDLGGLLGLRQVAAIPSWDARQMIGEPNTPKAGDYATAWAPRTQDGQKAWVELDYKEALSPKAIHIYESYCPGAVYQVTAVIDKKETLLWKGVDPTPRDAGMGTSQIPVDTDLEFKRIRIYVNCKAVPGYNEIDAVAMIDAKNDPHWAVDARASSVYSQNVNIKFVDPFQTKEDQLAEQTAELRAKIDTLKKSVRQYEAAIEKANAQIKLLYRQLDEL